MAQTATPRAAAVAPRGGVINPPFGAYALNGAPAALCRLSAAGLPLISDGARTVGKRIYASRLSGPVDVATANGLKLRLHPFDNNCERKFLFGARHWNAAERQFLTAAILAAEEPFVFVDVGANVGLYTLDVLAVARHAGRQAEAIAIEPDATNRRRLLQNLRFSDLSATVLADAVSDREGSVSLSCGEGSRGTIRISNDNDNDNDSGGGVTSVIARPLHAMIKDAGATRVHALKIDVEGMDRRVLSHFFNHAPPALQPSWIVCETGPADPQGLIPFLKEHGYALRLRTRRNACAERRAA